jgi:hypothetical protein
MKIAVTTIAKDEEKHVERWAASSVDADYRLVLDTGSRDSTMERLRDSGVFVTSRDVTPWRFDTARNIALDLLPRDIDFVISLDMDEVLHPGWRDALENAGRADQYMYHYWWSPEVYFYADHCHRREHFRWKHPVHETLINDLPEPTIGFAGFTIEHLPDAAKPRTQYLDLLRMAVGESPNDDRMAHYYGRELYFRGDWEAARRELMRHLTISSWPSERAQSFQYLAEMDYFPERWILRAIAENPNRREPWIQLIHHYRKEGRPVDSLVARVLTITERPVDYMVEAKAWNDDYVRSLNV